MNATPTMEEMTEAAVILSKDNLAAMAVMLQKNYVPEWFHLEVCKVLEQVLRGEIKHLIFTMPPQHGKSELSSIKFPLFALGNRPDVRIIEVCYSGDVATRFGREVRNGFSMPQYKAIFPGVELREDSQAANRFNTTEGGYYLAAGRGGAITSYGCDIMILDDMFKNREEAESQTIRQKVWDDYVSTINTRLNKNSAIIMLMTRWHDDDLIGRVMALEGCDDEVVDPNTGEWRKATADDPDTMPRGKWHVVAFPAIATHDGPHRKRGEALWAVNYPVDYLEGLRSLDPDVFECMYQCNPVNEQSSEFQRSWFKYYQDHQCPSNLRIYITVDLAISKKDTADEVVIMVTGITSDLSVYVLDYRHGRRNDGFDPSQTIQHIFELAEIYKPVAVGIESVAYQEALIHFMEKEMRLRKTPLNVVEIKTKQDKSMKIRGLIPYYKTGRLYHRAGGYCSALEQQLLRFPKGAHDDIVDALAMSAELWNAPTITIPQKQRPKTRIQAMKEEGLLIRR